MKSKPSPAISPDHKEIAELYHSTRKTFYLNQHDETESIMIDTESFSRREKMLKLREELSAVEKERAAGSMGYTPDELDIYLEDVINKADKTTNSVQGDTP